MSLEQNRESLRGLMVLTRKFQQTVSQKTEGARFLRSEERSAALCEQVRRARHHLQLALDALEGQPIEERTGAETPADLGHGWLRERIGGLVGVLSGGGQPERRADSAAAPASGRLIGDSSALGIPDLVGALHAQGQTGVLTVEQAEETIELHFDRGALVHAFSHGSPAGMRLGEVLVRQGAMTEPELASALAQHAATGQHLGEVLTKGGWVETQQLAAALTEQVQDLFRRLWSRPEARYTFEPGQPSGEGRAAWNVTQLLLEGARRRDDGQRQAS